MEKPKKHSPSPWTAEQGQVMNAEGNSIGTYNPETELGQHDGELMATAPQLLAYMEKSDALIAHTIKIINMMIRHEIHTTDLMSTLADLVDTLYARQKEVHETLDKWRE